MASRGVGILRGEAAHRRSANPRARSPDGSRPGRSRSLADAGLARDEERATATLLCLVEGLVQDPKQRIPTDEDRALDRRGASPSCWAV